MRPKTVVLTISRQFASGGSYIGQRVAQRLGMRYTDRDILSRAAAQTGHAETDLKACEERSGSFWKSFFRQYTLGAPEAPFVAPVPLPPDERDVFAIESEVIREIAAVADAVIVGRAAFHVLSDHPGLISIRVHAPLEWRIRRAMTTYGITSETEAAELISRSDQQRGRFVRAFSGCDWNDACVHHLCLDTGAIGLELASELVVTLVAARLTARRTGSA